MANRTIGRYEPDAEKPVVCHSVSNYGDIVRIGAGDAKVVVCYVVSRNNVVWRPVKCDACIGVSFNVVSRNSVVGRRFKIHTDGAVRNAVAGNGVVV